MIVVIVVVIIVVVIVMAIAMTRVTCATIGLVVVPPTPVDARVSAGVAPYAIISIVVFGVATGDVTTTGQPGVRESRCGRP